MGAALLYGLLLVAAAQSPQPPAPFDRAAALAQIVDARSAAARRGEVASLLRAHGGDIEAWAEALAHFGNFEPAPAGIHTQTVDLEVLGKSETTELWFYVPAKYDPAVRSPLLLAFHGTGGSGQGMHLMWQKLADEQGLLVLAPSEAGDNSGYHFADRERAAALAALRWMRRRFNVDENRIYASGISRGGHLTWDLALRNPDVFAAIAPMIGGLRLTLVAGQNNMRLLENVANLPIRDLQGAQDDPNLVQTVRLAFDLLGRFAPRDAKLLEFPDRGHDFDFEAVDWSQWLGSSVREPWPERVLRCTAVKDEARTAWLEITGLDKDVDEVFVPKINQGEIASMNQEQKWRFYVAEAVKRNARAVARRTAPGSFSLELDSATKARLYLRAEDLTDGGKISVRLAGKTLERKARADLRSMLEDFAERFDRTAIVYAKIDLP